MNVWTTSQDRKNLTVVERCPLLEVRRYSLVLKRRLPTRLLSQDYSRYGLGEQSDCSICMSLLMVFNYKSN